MGKNSGIAWTNHTFNPWHGCLKVSPACDNCYAEAVDKRFSDEGDTHWGKDAPRKFFGDKHWNDPRRWNRIAAKAGIRERVFCASMSDVFEGDRPDIEPSRARLWELIKETPSLDWLLLTKRPQNIKRMLPEAMQGAHNIWLGTTIESEEYLWRADKLIGIPAVVHFLSMEPLLTKTSLSEGITKWGILPNHTLDWVITGCESGTGARTTPVDWYRQLRDECRMAGVPFFLKQAPQGMDGISSGDGSWLKLRDGIVEQPYMDGTQHIEVPQPKVAPSTLF